MKSFLRWLLNLLDHQEQSTQDRAAAVKEKVSVALSGLTGLIEELQEDIEEIQAAKAASVTRVSELNAEISSEQQSQKDLDAEETRVQSISKNIQTLLGE